MDRHYRCGGVNFRSAPTQLRPSLITRAAALGGMSRALFKAAEAFIGHRKGGVAMAAIGACAGFGSICGSSLATAATMGQVALPELRRAGYAGSLATGALAVQHHRKQGQP